MKNVLLLSILAILIIAGSVFSIRNRDNFSLPDLTTPNSNQSINSTEEFVKNKPDTTSLRIGGSSYTDTQSVYSVLYPNDYKLDTQDSLHTRIFKTGATQKGQTEIYDGVIIVFETVNLNGQSLESLVNTRIDEAKSGGAYEISEPKKTVTLNTYPAFTYQVKGFGDATYLVIQKNSVSNYAVVISLSVNDPQKVGYQTEVDAILSTMELFK